jgi:hypothetical protein
MDIETDPTIDLSDAESVTLAGHRFLIPVLPLRQTIKIAALAPKLGELKAEGASESQMMDIAAIVHIALTRAYPSLTLDSFLDLPVTFDEILQAAPVILRQTRALRPIAKDGAAGEALAAS